MLRTIEEFGRETRTLVYAVLTVLLALAIYAPQLWVRHTLRKHGKAIPELPGTGGELAEPLALVNPKLGDDFRYRTDEAWEQVGRHSEVLIYTANAKGVHIRTASLSFQVEVEPIQPLSTIGAGDTFNAGLLYGIWKEGYGKEQIGSLNRNQWEALLGRAILFSREVCLSYENYLPQTFVKHFIK